MKRYLMMLAVTVLAIVFIAGMATAATEAEKQAAIDSALAYLASQQNADGSIGTSYRLAATASAVLAFAEQGSTINGGTYQTVVQNAMDFIFSRAYSQAISMQPAGDPDTNGNGTGVYFSYSSAVYETGLVLPAIVKAGTASSVVATGSQTGRTYADVVRDTVDYLAWGQNEPANQYRGGWRYGPNYSSSDNSVSQWPVIGMLYAEEWGINAPGFVADELELWANYIQNAGSGGSGYDSPTNNVDPGKTGGLLVEHAYIGTPMSDSRVQAALSYLNTNWDTSGADGNFENAYMMWSIYKGLELYIGINDETTITPRDQGAAVIDNPDHGWNWWEDYCEWLVSNQAASGAWTAYESYSDVWLRTAWYTNILAATEIPGPEPQVPEPATLLLLGLGLLGVGVIRKKS